MVSPPTCLYSLINTASMFLAEIPMRRAQKLETGTADLGYG